MARKWFGTKPFVEYTSSSGGTGDVVYDAAGAGNAVDSGTNSVNIQWSHTASGTDRVVIVAFLVGGVTGSASTFTRTVTYGGQAMDQLGYQVSSADNGWVELFGLNDPPTGAQTVSLTVAKAATSFGRVAGNSFSYSNTAGYGQILWGHAGSGTNTINYLRSNWNNFTKGIAGGRILCIGGVDSSATVVSMTPANSLNFDTTAPRPFEDTATLWMSNSGSTSGMTSFVVGDSPGTPYTVFTVQSSLASRLAVVQVLLEPIPLSVPAGIEGCWLTMIGAGGGGGSGRRGLSASARFGGDGGGGGAYVADRYIPASLLGSTYSVYVPPVASGGAAQTTNSTDGNHGRRAMDVMLSTDNINIICGSGHGGSGGSSALPSYYTTGGATGDNIGMGARGGLSNSGAGGQGREGLSGGVWTTPGGGAGGGISAGNAAGAGGPGGDNRESSLSGGAGGVVAGASPGSGSAAVAAIPGSGAGGGAASVSGTPQAGANATGYGAGGGGGGASLNGNASGAGGNGGPAYVRIMWDYR